MFGNGKIIYVVGFKMESSLVPVFVFLLKSYYLLHHHYFYISKQRLNIGLENF